MAGYKDIMSHLPRNGRYELFTHGLKTHCFDDLSLDNPVKARPEMFEWLRAQDSELCKPMDDTNVAFYLDPKIYVLWKLKWA
jgi:hypothetical protein